MICSRDDTFPQEEATYHEAVAGLKEIVPAPVVEEYIAACKTEVVSNILYAAYEGYRANLVNFYSLCSTTFPRMDFTDYIRDHLIGNFPPTAEATTFVSLSSKPSQKPPRRLRRLFPATLRRT